MDETAGDRGVGIAYILGFLVLLVAIGLSLHLVDTGNVFGADTDAVYTSRVVPFAVAAFLISLGFARFRTLRNEEVDFWYYSLAMFVSYSCSLTHRLTVRSSAPWQRGKSGARSYSRLPPNSNASG